jgi:uncharacterized protein involved in type VI secretion and phage assembly
MGYYDDDYALEQLRMEFRSLPMWQQEQITKSQDLFKKWVESTLYQQEQITKSQYSFKKWVKSTLSAIWNFITDIAVGKLAKRLWNVLFG